MPRMSVFSILFILAQQKIKCKCLKNIHKRRTHNILYSMRKLVYISILAAALTAASSAACAKNVNYSDYISEMRTAIYLYEDDSESIKIYCSEKESPFVADGIKGQTGGLVEIYATLDGSFDEVNVSGGNISGGDMSYLTVKDCWYLSYSGIAEGDEIALTLNRDGQTKDYTLIKVAGENVISCEQALQCVIEHDETLFERMTVNGIFEGEIFVRLLYDENCYYYVGVCGRDGNIHAFLVDGNSGRIIAEREHRI